MFSLDQLFEERCPDLQEEAEAQALEKEIKAAIVPLPEIPVEEPVLRTLMQSVQVLNFLY